VGAIRLELMTPAL